MAPDMDGMANWLHGSDRPCYDFFREYRVTLAQAIERRFRMQMKT